MNQNTSTIALVGKVVKNTVVTGKTNDGKKFQYNRLTVTTGNGMHWDTVTPRQGASKTTISIFSKAVAGDEIKFSDCFIDSFIYNGKACVEIKARAATK